MEAKDISLPVRIGVTTALAAATVAGAVVPEDKNVKTGAGVVGTLATLGYSWWAFKDTEEDRARRLTELALAPLTSKSAAEIQGLLHPESNKTLTAVGVGVAATGVIATAMYFLGGREAPHVPSFGELTGAAKREIGFGSFETNLKNIEKLRRRFAIASEKARVDYAQDPEKLRAALDAIDAERLALEQQEKYLATERLVAARRAYTRKGIGFGATATEYGDDY